MNLMLSLYGGLIIIMDSAIMKKKYAKALKNVNHKIDGIKKVFNNLKTIMNSGGHTHKSLEDKYKGIVKAGTEEENGTVVKYIRVFDNKDKTKLKYEIKYGMNGVSIKVTNDPNHKGIHYVKFADFNCNVMKEVIYNHHSFDIIENYNMTILDDGEVKVKYNTVDIENKSFIGKIFAFLRKHKYIY